MAIINLYSGTFKGAVIMTGNSMGISTAAGTQIGAFAIGLPTNTPPAGTTTTIPANNSSSARLTVPAAGTVVSAFLLWSATSSSASGSIGSGNQNTPITLRDPRGITTSVTPAVTYRQTSGTITPGITSIYSNAANITSIVQAAGSGFYTPGGILGVTGANGEHNGWMMMVAYQDQSEPYRNINMWTALNSVQGGATPRFVDISISGFSTPSTGATPGRLILSAGNGNAEISGDFVRFGPTISLLATLSGPNNQATNFFASQINNNSGALDTTGTFGTRNSTPGVQTPVGSRNNWDVTRVDASPGLTNNQNRAIIRVGTVSDTLIITGVGLQVDVNSANLAPMIKTVDKGYADVGEILTYTVSFKNTGLVSADNTVFLDTIPSGTTFLAGTVEINGNNNPTANPAPPSGISLGSIGPNQTTTVRFQVKVAETLPTPNPIQNTAETLYTFIPATSLASQNGESMSTVATTTIATVVTSSTKGVDKVFATIGDTVTYTIVIQNTGNTSANNVKLIDTIPNGTTYITGTLRQDGAPVAGSLDPPGVTLNTIGPMTTSTILFSVQVSQFPAPNPFTNNAAVGYTYTSDPAKPNVNGGNTQTNTVATQVNSATIANPTKIVDREYASCGDTLSYTINIPNSGNMTAINVILKDTIPSGTVLVPDSVYVNGVQQIGIDPSTGVSVGDIGPGATASVAFSVIVQC